MPGAKLQDGEQRQCWYEAILLPVFFDDTFVVDTKASSVALAIGASRVVKAVWATSDTSTKAKTAAVSAECAVGNRPPSRCGRSHFGQRTEPTIALLRSVTASAQVLIMLVRG